MFPVNETAKGLIADHFRKRRIALTEDTILEVIRAPRSKYDVYWGVLALRDIGSTRSVPVLKSLLHYPMQDVRDCALLTIAHIAGAAETDFFVEALADKRTRKTYPMWAIEVAADGRALRAVVEFINTALKKAIRRNPADPGDAYLSGVRYLARVGIDQPECRSSLELLRQAWPNLPEGHRSALRAVLPSRAIPHDVNAG